MEIETIKNVNGDINSLQVSTLLEVPAGDFNPGRGVLIKNITEEAVEVSVKLVKNKSFITTILYPGWNPEIIAEIDDAPADTFQYGY